MRCKFFTLGSPGHYELLFVNSIKERKKVGGGAREAEGRNSKQN